MELCVGASSVPLCSPTTTTVEHRQLGCATAGQIGGHVSMEFLVTPEKVPSQN